MYGKVRVAHDIKDFDEGEEVILTLKDQHLIKGENLNDEIEELQNTELREKGEAQFNSYLKDNIQKLAHAETSHIQHKLEGNAERSLLPHYDEHKYKKEGFVIEQEEHNNNFKAPKVVTEEIKQQKEMESLMLKQNKLANEYEQSEKKVFKPRKVEKSKNAKELISFLEETAMDDEDQRDTRKRAAQQLIDHLDVVKKKRNFDRAIEKAQQTNKQVQERMKEIEDYQIELSLRRKKKQADTLENNAVANLVASNNSQPKTQESNTVQLDFDPLKFAQPGNAPAPLQPTMNLKQARSGMTSVLNVSLPSERFAKKDLQAQMELPENFEDIPEQQLERMKEQLAFMRQDDVGVGLAGALKYLRQQGMTNQQQYVGRSKDKKPTLDQSEDRIKLQYRDASGRLMTPKEAFRYMCWIFHGEGPGKNKIEKRKKRDLINQKMKSSQPGQSTTMRMLARHQKQSGDAHMVIGRQK